MRWPRSGHRDIKGSGFVLFDQKPVGWTSSLTRQEEHPPRPHEEAYGIILGRAPNRCYMMCNGMPVDNVGDFFHSGPGIVLLVWDDPHIGNELELLVELERQHYYELQPDGKNLSTHVPATQITFLLREKEVIPPVAIHRTEPFRGSFDPNNLKDAHVRDLARFHD